MFGFDRITFDPDIMGGRACIRGMRIAVSLIVNLVANGMTTAEIIEEYPDLEAEDIRQALRSQPGPPKGLQRFDSAQTQITGPLGA